MIIVEEYPAFNIKDTAKSSAKDDIIQAIVNDLFAYHNITTHDLDKYVSIINYRLEMHYHRFFDKHEYKFKAKYSSDDNNLNLDLYKDDQTTDMFSFLDMVADNIKKEWENLS